MEEFWGEEHEVLASSEDTVFVVSPDDKLIQELRCFCAAGNLRLYEGESDSRDVIAVPYLIGVIDKEWLGEKAWTDWIDFLREAKGEQHNHLLIIVLRDNVAGQVRSELERELSDLHDAVCFTIVGDSAAVVEAMEVWLRNGTIQAAKKSSDVSRAWTAFDSRESRGTDFRHRLAELIDRFPCSDPMAKVEIQPYFKWRMRAKWLLADHLGEDHPYFKEFSLMLGVEMDPYFLGMHITAGKGILEALLADFDCGFIGINCGSHEESRMGAGDARHSGVTREPEM